MKYLTKLSLILIASLLSFSAMTKENYELVIVEHAKEQLDKQQYQKAKAYLEEALTSRDSKISNWAREVLAWMYLTGNGVKKDPQQARHYLEQRIQKNKQDNLSLTINTPQNKLNSPTDYGQVMADYAKQYVEQQNYDVAKHYLDEAAQSDNASASAWAKHILGWMYLTGTGVSLNKPKAKAYIQAAADGGDTWAASQLAQFCQTQFQQDNDSKKAITCFEKGNSYSSLGQLYYLGNGVPQDFLMAKGYFELGIQENNWDWLSINNLGLMYFRGQAVNKDVQKAHALFKQAENLPEAKNNLAWLYFNGYGLKKDIIKGLSLFEEAAKLGSQSAANNLAWLYKNGISVQKNKDLAEYWLEQTRLMMQDNQLHQLSYLNDPASVINIVNGRIIILPDPFLLTKKDNNNIENKFQNISVYASTEQLGFYIPVSPQGIASTSLQELDNPTSFSVTINYNGDSKHYQQQVDTTYLKISELATKNKFVITSHSEAHAQTQLNIKDSFLEINKQITQSMEAYLNTVQKPVLPRLDPKLQTDVIPQPILPPSPILTKSQFETNEDFQLRVQTALDNREKNIERLQSNYRLQVETRNKNIQKSVAIQQQKIDQLVKTYNQRINKIKTQFELERKIQTAIAFRQVLGSPYLSTLNYDAESDQLYADIKMTNLEPAKKVILKLPSEEAKALYKNKTHVNVTLDYKFLANNDVVLDKIKLHHNTNTYLASLTNKSFKPTVLQVHINTKTIKLNTPQLKVQDYKILADQQLQNPNLLDQHQISAITYVNNQERKKGKPLFIDDIPSLLAKAKAEKVNNKRWLFVIGIEDYQQTDNIKYAKRSAELFIQVAQKTLGISKRNTYSLINSQATVGAIKDKLRLMLANVKAEDEIFFYYNGHGIPDPLNNNEPYILASDKIPDFVTEDSFFKLKNIYKLLSDSRAKQNVVFIDSCFSGATDGVPIIKGVAASRLAPKKVEFNQQKMVALTAGSKKQYSNVFAEKGNRLFSYYLMKQLLAGERDINKLYKAVRSQVREQSLKMGDLKKQEPSIEGNKTLNI